MKLVTYSEGGRPEARLGAIVRDDVVDLSRLHGLLLRRKGEPLWHALAEAELPPSMRAFLDGGERAMARAREALAAVERELGDGRSRADLAAAGIVVPLAGVRLRAPVPDPRRILCLGLNYRDHAEETGMPVPKEPILFAKWATCLVGPGEPVVLPAASSQVDYEVEFCVVIGRPARNVRASDAPSYVAGYTIVNDVSARDWQQRVSQWTAGKNFDTFAPCGPAVVTADEVGDPHALDVALTLNGNTMQHSNTKNLIFNVWTTIEYVSRIMTLLPGDLIPTGTPAGVGMSRKPPVWLKPGDVCRLTIERLGVLESPFVAEEKGRS